MNSKSPLFKTIAWNPQLARDQEYRDLAALSRGRFYETDHLDQTASGAATAADRERRLAATGYGETSIQAFHGPGHLPAVHPIKNLSKNIE